MAGKAVTKQTIKQNTIEDMKKLGLYKAEFDAIIDIYAELREQYERLTKEYKDCGYIYKSDTGAGGEKKSAIVATLESLRKDILLYSDRLCLNPKALKDTKSTDPKRKVSALEKALMELNG